MFIGICSRSQVSVYRTIGGENGRIWRKKHGAHPQGELGLSHKLPERVSTIKIVEKKAVSMTWLYSIHSPACAVYNSFFQTCVNGHFKFYELIR